MHQIVENFERNARFKDDNEAEIIRQKLERLQSWTKMLRKMHVVCVIWKYFPLKPGSLKILPPPPPTNHVEVWPDNFYCLLNNIDQGGVGGGRSILSEPGFRGKYFQITHTTCIFLNIFVQDCIFEILNGMRHSKHFKWKESVFSRE